MTDTCIYCNGCKCKFVDNETSKNEEFGFKRLNERYKSCVKCRLRSRQQTCDNCGCLRNKKSSSIHKRRYYCQTFQLEDKPDFETWLKSQDYDKLLGDYKKKLNGELDIKDYEYYIG